MRTILNAQMGTALNKQVNAEMWSAYLYLSMSYDMKIKGFPGMATGLPHRPKKNSNMHNAL